MRRYPQFRSTPSDVQALPSVGSPPVAAQTVRRKSSSVGNITSAVQSLLAVPASGSTNTTINGAIGAAVAAGASAAVALHVVVDGLVGAAVAAGLPATVNLGTGVTVSAAVGDASAQGAAASVVLHTAVPAAVGGAAATGFAASIIIGSGGVVGAADVWNYVLSNGLTAEQNVVSILALLSELHLIHGLTLGSPLSVSATARSAGPVSQTVAEAGSVVTVTRQ